MSHAIKQHPLQESRVSSAQDDPGNCFNKLRWKMLRDHRDTDLYWFFEDDPASLSKHSGIITEWLLLLLVDLNIPTPQELNGPHFSFPYHANSSDTIFSLHALQNDIVGNVFIPKDRKTHEWMVALHAYTYVRTCTKIFQHEPHTNILSKGRCRCCHDERWRCRKVDELPVDALQAMYRELHKVGNFVRHGQVATKRTHTHTHTTYTLSSLSHTPIH
jgi:hypothetical protein